MVINTVGHLAEVAWHHPDITGSYAWVEVRLMNHAAKGITDKDFALAKKIEEVVHWQPGAEEGGALEGTPAEDMRFAYIKYDKPKNGFPGGPGQRTRRAPRANSRACVGNGTCLMVRAYGGVLNGGEGRRAKRAPSARPKCSATRDCP